MIVLFTDYGLTGPYLGQVEIVLNDIVPHSRVVTLMADAPPHNPKASAYLLSALGRNLPANSVVFSVVDPGVGSNNDKPIIIKAIDKWYVGPDNGLFDLVCRNSDDICTWEITWQPNNLSNTFHGRDLYAPVCAMLEMGENPPGVEFKWQDQHNWPNALDEIIYIDQFGNCMTGIPKGQLSNEAILEVSGNLFKQAITFANVRQGQGFWYENSSGLVEIAVNQGSAAKLFGLEISDKVQLV